MKTARQVIVGLGIGLVILIAGSVGGTLARVLFALNDKDDKLAGDIARVEVATHQLLANVASRDDLAGLEKRIEGRITRVENKIERIEDKIDKLTDIILQDRQ